jgi:hypothetical protein
MIEASTEGAVPAEPTVEERWYRVLTEGENIAFELKGTNERTGVRVRRAESFVAI